MPRINIEDRVEQAPEFWRLKKIIESRFPQLTMWDHHDMALGMLTRFFRLAQECFTQDRVMTQEDLVRFQLNDMVDSGWAVEAPGGYYCRGQNRQFQWTAAKKEAGRIGGLRKAENAKKRLAEMEKNPSRKSKNTNENKDMLADLACATSSTLSSPLLSSVKTNTLSCAGRAHDETNETVYQAYPPRRGDRAKAKALGVLSKIPPSEIGAVMRGVSNFKAWCDANGKTGTEFVPMMSTWLNQRRWLDWQDPPTYGNTPVPIPVETAEEGAVEAGKKLEEQFPEAFARVRSKLAASEPRGAQ